MTPLIVRITRMAHGFLAGIAATIFLVAEARIVPQASIVVVHSPDGSALLRIDPAPQFSRREGQHAMASVFKLDPVSGGYLLAATFALRNPVAPDLAAISNGGDYVITLDDWDAIGTTENTVVVYRGTGEFLKSWSLDDLFTAEEARRFEVKMSNFHAFRWRGTSVQLRSDFLTTTVGIPPAQGSPWQVHLQLDLKTLRFERVLEHWIDPKTGAVVAPPDDSSGGKRK